jgi:hypothetical protein
MVSRLLPAAAGASGGPLSVSFTSAMVSPVGGSVKKGKKDGRLDFHSRYIRYFDINIF